MTRVPSDDPGFTLSDMTERVAGAIRRHALAAAHASLRSIQDLIARFPVNRSEAARTPASAPAAPAEPPREAQRSRPADQLPMPPPPELLRSDVPLPDSYGTERVVLLVRDPHCLFAYWDLSEACRRSVREQATSESLRLILRTYDVTKVSFDARPPGRFQDFQVAGQARSVYAYVGRPASCFVAEIGYLRGDGTFFPLARSQPVWTPRTEQPGEAPGRWMTVGWTERPGQNGAGAVAPSEPQPATLPAAATSSVASADRPVTVNDAPSSWPGPAPLGAQRGSWSLVRGGRTTTGLDTTPSEP